MSIDFARLLPLGWSNFFSTRIPLEALERVRPARVVRVERDRYGVDAGEGEFFATLAGRVRHEHEGEALPTVGDWVLLATDDPVIVQCLERRTLIARRPAGGGGQHRPHGGGRRSRCGIQCAPDRTLPGDGGAGAGEPLVLLTKADLVDDSAPALEQVRARLPAEAEVLAVNARRDPLAEWLAPWLTAGTTLVVVGSSGVGKSTVVNNLAA